MLKVVHLSTTPLVGAPGNLCRALNDHGQVQARWVCLRSDVGLYQQMPFATDLCWQRQREEALHAIEQADVLHLHNFIDLDSADFQPVDFRRRWQQGQPMVRQFHSQPALVAQGTGRTVAQVHACPIPKLVIPQYPERHFATARLVPNMVYVPPRPPAAAPAGAPRGALRIGYAPSRFNSAHSSRWDTKGYPETVTVLRRLARAARARGLHVEIDLIEQVGHAECLRRKAGCDLFIDDLVTGSYHLNTLEALAQGVPCATYLDARTAEVVRQVTGGHDLPVVNVGLEHAATVLLELCARPERLQALGVAGRAWMDRHWTGVHAAQTLGDIYRSVAAHPGRPFAQRFDEDDTGERWHVREQHDALWQARRAGWPRPVPPWLLGAKTAAGRVARALHLR